MKNLIFIVLFCLTNTINAFAQEGWSVGVEAMPTMFWIYNKYDWDAETSMQGRDPLFLIPNGFHTGISVKRAINERCEVGIGLVYAYGKQKYFPSDNPTGTRSTGRGTRKDEIYTELKHIKLPISITGFLLEEGSSPYLQVGIVPTYLLGLTELRREMEIELDNTTVLNDYTYKRTESYVLFVNKNKGQPDRVQEIISKQGAYNGFALAALLNIGYKIKIADNFDIRIQATGETTFTKIETRIEGFLREGDPKPNRPPSYIINAGLSISANYIF